MDIGFVFFVASLKKGHYRFQFTQFAWTHMALYLIVVQAHFIMNNIFEGMIWFFLPVSLVIANDIFAYVVGITFGRTQLIKLSPKKTVEGKLSRPIECLYFVLMTLCRFRGCLDMHHPQRIPLHQHSHALQLLHLSGQRP